MKKLNHKQKRQQAAKARKGNAPRTKDATGERTLHPTKGWRK